MQIQHLFYILVTQTYVLLKSTAAYHNATLNNEEFPHNQGQHMASFNGYYNGLPWYDYWLCECTVYY